MSFNTRMRRILASAAVILGSFSLPVAAQEESAWQVKCLEARVCELKTEILRGENVAARLSVFHIRGYYFLQYTMPLGIDLETGVAVGVDSEPQKQTTLSNCSGAGCTGILDLGSDDIAAMKAGDVIRLYFTSPNNLDDFAIGFDLAGFTAGFDELISK